MVNYASGLMKLVDVEVFEKFSEILCQELTYLIGYGVTRFTKDFCLIMGLHCDEPYDLKKFGFVGESSKGNGKVVKGKGKVKTTPKKAMKKDEDDALKMGLVYFVEGVLIGAKSNVSVNLEYLDLVKDMDRFNIYS
ncbi:unnamed protein product [Malus baccata var. baccata]